MILLDSGVALGSLWDNFWHMNVTLGALGAHFGHTRVTLVVLWSHFGVNFGMRGDFGCHLGQLWGHF